MVCRALRTSPPVGYTTPSTTRWGKVSVFDNITATASTVRIGLALGSGVSSPAHAPGSCGYQTSGSGVCNSTIWGYPFSPLAQLLADTPTTFKVQTNDIIPDSDFRNDSYNTNTSRAGSLMIFVSWGRGTLPGMPRTPGLSSR